MKKFPDLPATAEFRYQPECGLIEASGNTRLKHIIHPGSGGHGVLKTLPSAVSDTSRRERIPGNSQFRTLGTIIMMGGCFLASDIARCSEEMESLKASAMTEISSAEADAKVRRDDLAKKYAGALASLEKSLASKGDLDAILRVREEREAVEKTGSTTPHQDKAIVELRGKYQTALAGIDAGLAAAKSKVTTSVTDKLKQQETTLTKAGRVEEALALRKQGESLMAELSGGGAAKEETVFAEDPRATKAQQLKPLSSIKIPAETPPEDPKVFSTKGRWLESLTVPKVKQRIREPIIIGDRGKKKWPLVVVAPSSIWASSDTGKIELSGGNFVAKKSKFENFPMVADLACTYYFSACDFDNCRFAKGGIWFGSHLAGKFYFEGCVIRKTFANSIHVTDNGFRAEASVFEKIKFPPMKFGKGHAADFVNNPWLRFNGCRFVDCTIPLSFLLLTRNCVFQDCTFTDDDKAEVGTKAIETVIYVRNCKSAISKKPPNVTIVEKAEADLENVKVPTLDDLVRAMEN